MDVTVTRRHIKKDFFESRSEGYFGFPGGKTGREVELRENAGWVEWKYSGDANWIQLYQIGMVADVTEIPTGAVNGVNDEFELINIPVTGSVRVYLNGVRQVVGINYTVVSNVINFTLAAPFTNDHILVDYKTFIVPVNYVYNEIPTGDVDGVNTDFVLLHIPVSLIVYLNGVRQQEGVQYVITDDTITFIDPDENPMAPFVGDLIICDYTY
jgi:hypothetical protein